ncbi:alkaline phosphatase family protein [Robertmurraya korlensis]|uniref:alkaline phosphatase family protein n=1 Tax=Robertmurraya korlensis TaxID=519977 RepID=UPI0008255FEF|nr:ectonucleotide pyrophosphatase/phosphodiesterase [Robertmurraya korlensis]
MGPLTDHLIVISFDCLSGLDFPTLETLPNFRKLLINSSYCKNVKTIYPSVTYPCHATIVTGKLPKNHGIINNTLLQPGKVSPDWYWYRRDIQGTTLYDEAKQQGMSTAALLWPVTAKANIDYNMPEIFANRRWHHQIPVSLVNGSSLYQLEMNKKFGHIRKGLSQPELDDFVLEAAVETIRMKKPNLLLVHFTDLDTKRHETGFSSQEAIAAIKRHDNRLGRIMDAVKLAGIEQKSTIIAIGDHSAIDESKVLKPNVLFHEHGLLNVGKNNKVIDWKAYCKSCDGSAYIYIKNHDPRTIKMVRQLLTRSEIEAIWSSEEASRFGADPNCSLMIEAARDYYFHESVEGTFIDEITQKDVASKKYTKACHGYSPEKKDYDTLFIASGKGIQSGHVLPSMHLIDEGPTLARLLGLDLGKVDGRVVEEILIL